MKRLTRQRSAILNCLTAADHPLSIEEILAVTTDEIPEINLSTIYRNIRSLLKEGTISSITLPGSNARYEIAASLHQHHFLCEKCNRVFNIPKCPKGLQDLVPKGFKLHSHSITLTGLCPACIN
ncbi:MAG: transcriptional repressor [Parachlamydiaceae bacterium]|nr:transcriptional repressor [Parachlamydiaceae bacterium]